MSATKVCGFSKDFGSGVFHFFSKKIKIGRFNGKKNVDTSSVYLSHRKPTVLVVQQFCNYLSGNLGDLND